MKMLPRVFRPHLIARLTAMLSLVCAEAAFAQSEQSSGGALSLLTIVAAAPTTPVTGVPPRALTTSVPGATGILSTEATAAGFRVRVISRPIGHGYYGTILRLTVPEIERSAYLRAFVLARERYGDPPSARRWLMLSNFLSYRKLDDESIWFPPARTNRDRIEWEHQGEEARRIHVDPDEPLLVRVELLSKAEAARQEPPGRQSLLRRIRNVFATADRHVVVAVRAPSYPMIPR